MKTLILGGCRSGKSNFAEQHANQHFQRKYFLATLEAGGDAEMRKRIDLHVASRGENWQTIEEPYEVVRVMLAAQADADVFVVDCITMWLTNMFCRGMKEGAIEEQVRNLVASFAEIAVPVLFVANEVGLGIVPESPLGRKFRDLAGWTNQQLAGACDEVVFVAAGLPLYLKHKE